MNLEEWRRRGVVGRRRVREVQPAPQRTEGELHALRSALAADVALWGYGGGGTVAQPTSEDADGERYRWGERASGSAPHQQLSERVCVVRQAPRRHDAGSTAPAERLRTRARVPALCGDPCSGL